MAYTHVAHDCILEDDIVMTNNAGIAGGKGLQRSKTKLTLLKCINFAI